MSMMTNTVMIRMKIFRILESPWNYCIQASLGRASPKQLGNTRVGVLSYLDTYLTRIMI